MPRRNITIMTKIKQYDAKFRKSSASCMREEVRERNEL
jgi:hypothetical protein